MRSTLTALALIALTLSSSAQTPCGAAGVDVIVTPTVAAPGETFSVTLINNTAGQITAGGCLITGIFPDGACATTSMGPFLCPLILQILSPGDVAIDEWNQLSPMGQVPAGTYSLEVTWGDVNGSNSCCIPITIEEPTSCFGDGGDQMGCTDCPCGNNAAPGTGGGCKHSQSDAMFGGAGAQLIKAGSSSLAVNDLCFSMINAKPDSFGVLTSSNTLAPANPANPCFAQNPGSGIISTSLDGLRCVVQGVLRHGSRPILSDGTAGVSSNGWGACSPTFPNSTGFAAGEQRYFQVIYREEPGLVCTTEQNTSQAVSVTFTP